MGNLKGGFLCARQTGTSWEKIGGGGSAIWFCYGGFFEMELSNVHIIKYIGSAVTLTHTGGVGVSHYPIPNMSRLAIHFGYNGRVRILTCQIFKFDNVNQCCKIDLVVQKTTFINKQKGI